VGVFSDRAQAQKAVQELKQAGFRDDQIGVIARDHEKDTAKTTTRTGDTHASEGAVAGVAAGAGIGALWGIGIAAGLVPAIGPVIAGGTLAAILASAATGAAAAGIVGSLIGMGIPEEEAHYYDSEIRAGRTVVTVRADSRYDEALAILRRFNAYDSSSRSTAAASATTGAACQTVLAATPRAAAASPTSGATGGQKVQVREEELHVHKQPVETGEVRVRKEVHTEQRTLQVPVQKEEIVVERRPVSGHAPASGDLRSGEEVRIPVREEQVHVEKRAVVKEEVAVGKRQVQDVENVSGSVRKEELKIDKKGDVDVRGDTRK